MSNVKIEGKEYPIGKVFSDDFAFTIPLYQRPYAWTVEQAGEMLEDFIISLEDDSQPIEEVNPYFLGSIVLIKGDTPDAQVVDGQQRLTTLTILLAALRASVPEEHFNDLTTYLYQKGSKISGIPNRYRLSLRERDAEFFKEYIQDEGGINRLEELKDVKLSDSRQNIKDNAQLFAQRLQDFSDAHRLRLAQFIITRCFLVVVSTPDFDSAYRIFSVLNDRGLDLSHTDILKAEIIGKIPDIKEQEAYSVKWEDIETNLGREMFQELFEHIRMIKRKAKLRESLLKEFRQYVRPSENPQLFIDKTLNPLADAFYDIKNATYQSDVGWEELKRIFNWLNWLDNFDWVPPAILYLSENYNSPEELVCFFADLERLAAGFFIRRTHREKRIDRYARLLTAIESGENLYAEDSPLQLVHEERIDILRNLDADFLNEKIRLYVLLRLEAEISGNEASYKESPLTVEQVLPLNPAPGSMWAKWFPDARERPKYADCLGNLVLLPRRKNTEAQSFDFEMKKEQYFTVKTGAPPLALTARVLEEPEWTPAVIEGRQKELVDMLRKAWRL